MWGPWTEQSQHPKRQHAQKSEIRLVYQVEAGSWQEPLAIRLGLTPPGRCLGLSHPSWWMDLAPRPWTHISMSSNPSASTLQVETATLMGELAHSCRGLGSRRGWWHLGVLTCRHRDRERELVTTITGVPREEHLRPVLLPKHPQF